jgi:hypothetical protein
MMDTAIERQLAELAAPGAKSRPAYLRPLPTVGAGVPIGDARTGGAGDAYPPPAFDLDASWRIVGTDLANYEEDMPAIAIGKSFFDLMTIFPQQLPKSARAELHTWEMEMVRALMYFEYLARSQARGGGAPAERPLAHLGDRLMALGKTESLTALRQRARTGMKSVVDRLSILTFAQPVGICTVSLLSPFDQKMILRFTFTLQRPAPARPVAAGAARYRGTLVPQNPLTDEALGIMDHWKIDVIKKYLLHYDDIIHALTFMEHENPYREPDREGIAATVDAAAREVPARAAPTRTAEEDALVQELAARGVPFEVIPGAVYPGMHYVTPLALVESGATAYSQRHILMLIRHNEIGAIHLAGKVVLDAFAVRQLLDREAESAAENARAGGRRPGPRRPRAHRPARTA